MKNNRFLKAKNFQEQRKSIYKMSTTFSTKIATAVNGIDDIVTAMLWKIGENIDKTLEKIASEMEPQEISSDEEFKEHFLTTTVNQ